MKNGMSALAELYLLIIILEIVGKMIAYGF